MEVSIVSTMYYSAPYLQEFYERCTNEAKKLTSDYEIILVNDGSPDDSLQVAISLHQSDSRVKVIDLSRNFGHHKAMMTGLSYARGNYIFLIDSDLEEEPELLGEFHRKLLDSGSDVVYGVQKNRRGSIFEQVSGELYYQVLCSLSGINFPRNIITARLMTLRYVKNLLRHRERELTIAGIWHITGYQQLPVYVSKGFKGRSTYHFFKKVNLLINAITSFSNRPLIFIFYTGLSISVVSAYFVLELVVRKLFFNVGLEGWTSLIVSIWFVGGLIICFLGIIGLYISKIFIETKQRPYTIVRHIYR
jgi:putative glycosyltransferase